MDTRELIFDIMLLVSCAVMTLGIVGILRMPDVYTKIHGSSKSVFLGIVMLCVATSVIATAEMNMRLVLIALVVVITTPMSSHVIGRAAYLMHEQMETPGAVDESHTLLDESGSAVSEEPTWRL